MLDIYAQTFMIATRGRGVRVRDVPSVPHEKRLNWFSRRKTRRIDPNNL
jgi:hypothetical protein